MSGKIDDFRRAFEAAGQGHVFRFVDRLTPDEREGLLAEAGEIDLEELATLVDSLVLNPEKVVSFDELEPAPFIRHPANGGDSAIWAEARDRGEQALREGKVAAFTVAGGQGTRLGYDGPKGTFPATPVRGATLFQVFAEKILGASRRFGKTIPWLIMTSHANHEATVAAFEKEEYFGLDPDAVRFFRQGRMPAVDANGKILLAAKNRIAMSPDGHGGSLRALVRSGAIAEMRARGIEAISYFQVDNPLVRSIDPEFIGFHLMLGSEMSSKMIPKAYPLEKVGHFCRQGEQTVVVEYSDMPESMQKETDDSGQLRFLAGSIAIHVLATSFIERLGDPSSKQKLPFHRADKKIACIDSDGNPVNPVDPNGVKFEMFVFDALPMAVSPVIIETRRKEEFSPVKNATGIDSAETCRDDQLRQAARWLRAAGVELPVDKSGLPEARIEVSPLFADNEEDFVKKWRELPVKPQLVDGTVLM